MRHHLRGGAKMNRSLFALLIHDPSEHFESLKTTLKQLSIHTYSLSTCRQAEKLLSQCKPDPIFTESRVQDGSWLSIQNLADASGVPVSVVVVGSHPDTRLYMSVMELGAFDFVVPPFECESLEFIVQSAALNTYRLRGMVAPVARPNPIGNLREVRTSTTGLTGSAGSSSAGIDGMKVKQLGAGSVAP